MREEGYYWVKFEGKWTIGQYMPTPVSQYWQIIGNREFIEESWFDEIDERRTIVEKL